MVNHPVLEQFQVYATENDRGDSFTDWIGARWPNHLAKAWPSLLNESSKPQGGEDLFEWIDLLTAATAAKQRFSMVELGAGYGRWGIRGALAAKQRGLSNIDVRLVEAEPQHSEWARECVVLNGLSSNVRVIDAAIAYNGDSVPFIVDWDGLDAAKCYGQKVYLTEPLSPTEKLYFGHQVHRNPTGNYGLVFVQSTTLKEVIADLDRVDFLDADLQGAEMNLVENEMEVMTTKVALAHFGTHSEGIEEFVREQFRRYGWQCVWDFSLGGVRETPYGSTYFGDGVQSWLNPSLVRNKVEDELISLQAKMSTTIDELRALQAQYNSLCERFDCMTEGVQSWLLPTLAKHGAAIERHGHPVRVLRKRLGRLLFRRS